MTRIRCTSCHKTFEWDESTELEAGGGLARPHAPGASQLTVWCPHCQAGNKLWVRGIKTELVIAEEEGEAEDDEHTA